MDLFGIGPLEVLIILLIAYLVLGPARMVEIARSLSSFVREVRQATSELPDLLAIEEASKEPPRKGDDPQGAKPAAVDQEEDGPVAR